MVNHLVFAVDFQSTSDPEFHRYLGIQENQSRDLQVQPADSIGKRIALDQTKNMCVYIFTNHGWVIVPSTLGPVDDLGVPTPAAGYLGIFETPDGLHVLSAGGLTVWALLNEVEGKNLIRAEPEFQWHLPRTNVLENPECLRQSFALEKAATESKSA